LQKLIEHLLRSDVVSIEAKKLLESASPSRMRPDGNDKQYFINLDSELFYIPFGLGSVFRDKTHGYCGGFYAELCMITSYSIGWNAGQNMILENVTGLSDRLLPFGDGSTSLRPNAGGTPIEVALIDQVLGFIDSRNSDIVNEDITGAQPREA
jgi:hypothetical protein